MPGPIPKSKDRLQRRNAPPVNVVPFRESPVQVIPEAPADILASTTKQWGAFWTSPIAAAIDQSSDLGAITRLFTLVDERERAYRAYKSQRLIDGSRGQEVLNPMGRVMQELDSEIRQLEDRFGMNLKSRVALGIRFGEAAKTLNELNKQLNDDDSGGDASECDPRERAAANARSCSLPVD